MKHNFKLLIFVLSLMVTTNIYSQSDIEFFGFYQVRFNYEPKTIIVDATLPPQMGGTQLNMETYDVGHLHGGMQQLNLMLRKELGNRFTTFVNFEVLSNFSTKRDWGSIGVEDVWLNYNYKSTHNLRLGYFIPKFNYLHEIKNRMPLIPYITRPLIYETSLQNIFNYSDFVPEIAFAQLDGQFYSNELEFNYSAFVGPAEADYFATNTDRDYSGKDTTEFLSFGGRLGVNYKGLRLGVSSTIDKDNYQQWFQEDINRTRIGADFGFNYNNLFIEAEYIKVSLDAKKTNLELDKTFYYGTIGYDFSSSYFAFFSYSYVQDQAPWTHSQPGIKSYTLGAGYRVNDYIVFKGQFLNALSKGDRKIQRDPSSIVVLDGSQDYDIKYFSVAVSVLF